MPLPRSLAHLKREISEKKWDEARCLAGSRVTARKYKPTAKCWWCLYRTQTRDHVFKNCPHWKPQ
jgi:hypothetical protein